MATIHTTESAAQLVYEESGAPHTIAVEDAAGVLTIQVQPGEPFEDLDEAREAVADSLGAAQRERYQYTTSDERRERLHALGVSGQ